MYNLFLKSIVDFLDALLGLLILSPILLLLQLDFFC